MQRGPIITKMLGTKLLTHREQRKLFQVYQIEQTKLLKQCANYEAFRIQLKHVLNGRIDSSGDFESTSRRFTPESTKKENALTLRYLKELTKILDEPRSTTKIKSLLQKVQLSGTVVFSACEGIKAQSAVLNEYHKVLTDITKCLGLKDTDETEIAIEQMLNDKSIIYTLVEQTSDPASSKKLVTNAMQVLKKLSSKLLVEYSSGYRQSMDLVLGVISESSANVKRIRDVLVTRNMSLILRNVQKFRDRGMSEEDLIQEGAIGLLCAIDKYDLNKNTQFSTYATWWINMKIHRSIWNYARTIRIPVSIEGNINVVNKIIQKLTLNLGRAPTNAQILTEGKAQGRSLSLVAIKKAKDAVIVKCELPNDKSQTNDYFTDKSTNVVEALHTKQIRSILREVLAKLDPQEEMIIRLRYGIGEMDNPRVFEQIAERMGVSKSQVQKVHEKSLNSLKRLLKEVL